MAKNQGYFTVVETGADLLNGSLAQRDTAGNRLASAQEGKMFWDTTNERLERDNGAGWDIVVDNDPAVGVAGPRTLGGGAQQIAAGNHTH